jgi:N-acetyl-gamma-glutamyl-phosphate reductase
MKDSLKIAIAGATGYTGLELTKILSAHPKVKIQYLCAQKSIGKTISFFDKTLKKRELPKISKIEKINWKKINVLFAALPNGEAQKIAKKIPKNIILIDLSADFRLQNPKIYKKWYGTEHKSKNLINKSIYAITEFTRKKIKNYNIISCPGCYPTSIQIPLIPLIKKRLILSNQIIVDSKSGYSGAGKNLKKKFKTLNIFKSISAYSVGSHRHTSEIDQELSKANKSLINVIFTPHLSPMFRGILSTIYVDLPKKINAKIIYNYLKKYYKKNYFIKINKFNTPIGTGDVMNTNDCRISICENREKNKVIILSAIDNLIKGGSGQAVQNMNMYYGFNENLGFK